MTERTHFAAIVISVALSVGVLVAVVLHVLFGLPAGVSAVVTAALNVFFTWRLLRWRRQASCMSEDPS